MASVIHKVFVVFQLFCFIFVNPVLSIRTWNKIYINLKSESTCIRNLNSTHQVGCSSDKDGNVGTVYYVSSGHDVSWVTHNGPHHPYIVAINSADFNGTIVERLLSSGRVNGFMVINNLNASDKTSYPPHGFSSVDDCPNARFDMYAETTFMGCSVLRWNPSGTSLRFMDLGVPVFDLSDPEDIDGVLNKCFFPYNVKSREYPVCAAELKISMDAAVDAVTCLRRSNRFVLTLSGHRTYCDRLGDKNVVVTMKVVRENDTRENSSVIMIGARMDAVSMFQPVINAADTVVAGMVTLLATAEALWNARNVIRSKMDAKDIMFVFFQGETFDYIGSSRMVYDMIHDKFPQDYKSDELALHLKQIRLEHLDRIVELNQVGYRDNGFLWAHTDPFSGYLVSNMIRDLQMVGLNWNVSIRFANKNLPLPPASAQTFLKSRNDIPVMVITDHSWAYTNKFYNSRFDTPYLIDAADYPPYMPESLKYDYVTKQARLITDLSTTLAVYLYTASTGEDPTKDVLQNLTANSSTVTHLLYCFLISPNCELFAESLPEKVAEILKDINQPFPFYVGVEQALSAVTQLVHNILARFTGLRQRLQEGWCIRKRNKVRILVFNVKQIAQWNTFSLEYFKYVWMQGKWKTKKKREGWCLETQVMLTDAVSPAFVIDGYDMRSGNYSTWTESRWHVDAISARLFLLPSRDFQMTLLFIGLSVFLLSMSVVYFVVGKADVLFQNNSNNADGMSKSNCTTEDTVSIDNKTGALPGSSNKPGAIPGNSNKPGVIPGTSNKPGVISGTSNEPGVIPGTSNKPGVISHSVSLQAEK